MVFITKHLQDSKPQKKVFYQTNNENTANVANFATTRNDNDAKSKELKSDNVTEAPTNVKKVESRKKKNKITENKSDMNTSEKIAMAKNILGTDAKDNFKIIKSDKGLIERTESSKTILTEDNKELLID